MTTTIRKFDSFFYPFLFFSFYEDHNKECDLKKFEQFSKCSFGEIFKKRSATSHATSYGHGK